MTNDRLDQIVADLKRIVSEMEKEMREKVDPHLYETVDAPKVKNLPLGQREKVEAAFQTVIDAVEILAHRIPDLKSKVAEVSEASGAALDFDSLESALNKILREARVDLHAIRKV